MYSGWLVRMIALDDSVVSLTSVITAAQSITCHQCSDRWQDVTHHTQQLYSGLHHAPGTVSTALHNGVVITDKLVHKANAFNSYFLLLVSQTMEWFPNGAKLSSILDNVTIDESDVLSSISRLKNTLSAGLDNFPPPLSLSLRMVLLANSVIIDQSH